MALLTFNNFRGMLPVLSPYKLPENFAQIAQNCVFERGAIEGLDDNTIQGTVQKSTPACIFKCGAKWECWTSFVNVVRSWIYDSTSDRFYFTNGSQPSQMRESGINDCLSSSSASTTYNLGIDGPAGTPTIAVTDDGSPGTDVIASVAYVFTYLTSWDEESAPSPPSDVQDLHSDEYVTVTCPTPTAERAAATLITKIRIYRVASGKAGAEYQYLGEETIEAVTEDHIDRDGTDYAITPDAELGEAIQTENFDAPPAAMDGLISFSNGQMAGFTSNKVYLNEPFISYAFPEEYIKYVESDVVALGSIGNSLVVATQTHPYIATGTDPESMILDRLNDGEKCIAERGTVSTPYGVLYPSPNGLIGVNHNGATKLTEDRIYTKKQWSDLNPENFISFWYEDKYWAFILNANTGYVFCDLFTDNPYVVSIVLGEYPTGYEIQFLDAYVDPGSNLMYILVLSADASYYVLQFSQSVEGLPFSWKSKIENFKKPVVFGAGMINGKTGEDTFILTEADEYLLTEASDYLLAGLAEGSGYCTIKLNGDGVLKDDRSVPMDGTPFRLGGGADSSQNYMCRDWEVSIENAQGRIDEIQIATTMDELKRWG